MVVAAISLFFFTSSVVFAADGFAEGVTGGAGGTVVAVDSNAIDFENAVESTSTYIVEVNGTIDLSQDGVGGTVYIESNKTIMGVDSNATILGCLNFEDDANNVIIQRLTISNPNDYGGGDGIRVRDRITNVFITKCTVYDCPDGLIDITNGSDYVTVSWCKFYYVAQPTHRFSVLVGGDYPVPEDEGKFHVTFHHNWWSAFCHERMPSVRYGRAHIYNNYYDCSGNNYCIRSRGQAECLIESNYFKNVDETYYVYLPETPLGKIEAPLGSNIRDNCSGQVDDGDDDVFDPPYPYILDDANDVPFLAVNGAGADGNDMPHWLVGPYGDFTRDDIVDMNDLEQFVDYWLDTTDIDDADYDGDGNVNFYEFALMAENW